jgi:hypothetical protein
MSIEKAIEILEDYLRDCFTTATSNHAIAVKLGISALVRIQSMREDPNLSPAFALIGEAED